MRIDLNKLTFLSGLAGSLVLVICCCVIPVIPHPVGSKEAYSFLNHFVSELGYYKTSKLSVVFNSGIFISGFLLTMFAVGLMRHFRSRLGYVAAAFGIFSGIVFGLLGFFPVNLLKQHLILAFIFFSTWLPTVGLFTLLCLRDKGNVLFSKGVIISGVISFVLFISFLVIPFTMGMSRIMNAMIAGEFARPPFVLAAALEWSMFFSVAVWIMLVCLKLAGQRTAEPATIPSER